MQGLFLSSLMTVGTALISSSENFAYVAGAIHKILQSNWRYVNAGGALVPVFPGLSVRNRDYGAFPGPFGRVNPTFLAYCFAEKVKILRS